MLLLTILLMILNFVKTEGKKEKDVLLLNKK